MAENAYQLDFKDGPVSVNEDELTKTFGRMFEVVDQSQNIIKVIGVGGGGSNAVKNMVLKGFTNVTFAVVNTDSQALKKATVPTKIPIGSSGLGVGGVPEKGREAAEYSIEAIKGLFEDNTKMVFITAGMGGGTGTGASPVIARVAREMGILTVGVVTLPFGFEKRHRIDNALKGAKELKENVDSLLVINNERLMEIYNDEMTTVEDAFNKADEIVTTATRSIAEIITIEGKVNRDFCDVQTVMKEGGAAMMTSGRASGSHRIIKAMREALESPLLNKAEVERSQKILYIIYQSHKSQVKITELTEVNTFMDNMAPDLEVLWGLYWDDTLEDDVRVDIIATGFDKERVQTIESAALESRKAIDKMYDTYYGKEESGRVNIGAILDEKSNPNVINLNVSSTTEAEVLVADTAKSVDNSGDNEVADFVSADESGDSSPNVISFDGDDDSADGTVIPSDVQEEQMQDMSDVADDTSDITDTTEQPSLSMDVNANANGVTSETPKKGWLEYFRRKLEDLVTED